MIVQFELSGEPVTGDVPARTTLADCLRHPVNMTGTHVGCEYGVCGACTVVVSGDIVRFCLMLAVQVERAGVTTVECLSHSDDLPPSQTSLRKPRALQCGFCTPGVLTTAQALLSEEPDAGCEHTVTRPQAICAVAPAVAIVDAVCDVGAAYRSKD